MRLVSLGRHAKARVWLDALPPVEYVATAMLSTTLPIDPDMVVSHQFAAAELFVPFGARFEYGLLGCELRSSFEQALVVEVSVSGKEVATFSDSLTGRIERPMIGLPEELAFAVLKGVERSQQDGCALPAGKLLFRWAAHSVVGSSPHCFAQIAEAVVRLVRLKQGELSDAEIGELFQLNTDKAADASAATKS